MLSGPPPKPDALRQRRNRRTTWDPDCPIKVRHCPAWLGDLGKLEWRRVVRLMGGLNALTELDRAALAGYCESWEQMIEAQAKVRELGPVVLRKTDRGTAHAVVNPYLTAFHAAQDRVLRLAAELRLTPVSRTRAPLSRQVALPAPREIEAAPAVDPRIALRGIAGGKA